MKRIGEHSKHIRCCPALILMDTKSSCLSPGAEWVPRSWQSIAWDAIFSQLALDGCILYLWMRYLLPGNVFLHSRQEKLLLKTSLSMVEKHNTLQRLKFQMASRCQKVKGIKAPRSQVCWFLGWVFTAGRSLMASGFPSSSFLCTTWLYF